jgi:hypothetical protein
MIREIIAPKPRASRLHCKHHWVIEGPNGPTSAGVCKLCGEQRLFYNDPEQALLQPVEEPVAR